MSEKAGLNGLNPSLPHFPLDLGYQQIMHINVISGLLQQVLPFDCFRLRALFRLWLVAL